MLLIPLNWSRADLSDNWSSRDQWEAALAQAAPHSIFFAHEDVPQFLSYYLQDVEGKHKDIVVISATSLWQRYYLDLLPGATGSCETR